ncbi:MAG: InlB B-repeat-containing protein, partial [Clostridia bacterium]|nr:InlB B-repeat-containing protein [Clostridia bacterium]
IDGTEKPVVITPKYDGRPSFIVKLSDGISQFDLANKIKYTTCDGTPDGYISKFYDVNGNEITSIVPTWSEGEYTSLLEYKLAHKQEDYYDQPDCIVYLDDSHSIKVEFEVSWELPKDITVKFVTNTSEVPTPTSETVYYGDDNKYGDIFPDLEREGYTLDGWYLNKDFTGTKVTSDSVVKLTKSTDTTITLYAKWTKNS